MRRILFTVVASAAMLAGLGVSATTASAATVGWCDSWKKVTVTSSGYTIHQPMHSATGSRNCTLARGANGNAVSILQIALKQCNFTARLVVDGDFGERTENALRYAQGRRGTTADGIYGPNTRKALHWPVYYPNGGAVGSCRPSPS